MPDGPLVPSRNTSHEVPVTGEGLNLAVDLSVEVDSDKLTSLKADLLQALTDLKLEDQVQIE